MKKIVLVGNQNCEILLQVLSEKLLFEDLIMYQLVEPIRGGIYARKLDPKLKEADVETVIKAADEIISMSDIGDSVKEKIQGKTIIRLENYAPLETSPVSYITVECGLEWFPDVINIIKNVSLANYDFRLTSPDAWLDNILSLTKFRNNDAKMEIKLICSDGHTPQMEDIKNRCTVFLQSNLSYPEYCTQQIQSYQSEWKKNIHILENSKKDKQKKKSKIFLSCSRSVRIISSIQKDVINALDNGNIEKLLTIPRQEVEEVVSFLTYESLEGKRVEALTESGFALIANKNDMIISFLGSRQCNMKCKYCFSDHTHESKSTMPNKTALEIIEMLTSGQDNLNLHIDNNLGGEPLLDFTAVMLRHNEQ